MKINLKSAIETVGQKINAAKINKKEAQIKEFVNLDGINRSKEFNTLYDAREILANYAKAKGVRVSFHTFAPQNEGLKHTQGDNLIEIIVTGSNNKTKTNLINTSKEPSVVEAPVYRLLPIKDANVEYLHKGKITCEDNFLRRVYRTFETMVKNI